MSLPSDFEEFRPGTRVDDKFVIEAVIGQGGMGCIVRARHVVLERVVAIKFLRPAIASIPDAAVRFVREARAAALITNEHVARVLDVARLPNGAPYIVMECLEGRDLDAVVEESGPVSLEAAVDYVLQASIALAEAHGLGIVHRDLKPSNLFLTRGSDGRPLVKLLDFGISKAVGGEAAAKITLTGASTMLGSPLYASPEQTRAPGAVTVATDIWALGIVLYELITGRHPFEGPTLPTVWAAVLNDAPTPIAAHVRDLPPGFEEVVMRCLAKAPAERWRDVASLANALEPFAAPESRAHIERIRRIARSAPEVTEVMRNSPLPVLSHEQEVTTTETIAAETRVDPRLAATATATAFEFGAVARRVANRQLAVVGGAAAASVVALLIVVVTVATRRAAPPAMASTTMAETQAPDEAVIPSAANDLLALDSASSADEGVASASAAAAPPAASSGPTVAEALSAEPAPAAAPGDSAEAAKPRRRDRIAPSPPARAPTPTPSVHLRRYGGRE